MTNAISIHNLHKTYKNGVNALKGISFDIEKGSFFGLLGPNGSGKSTMINIISGPTRLSDGTVKIFNLDIYKHSQEVKMMLGVVPQEITFDSFFNVYEILELQSGYFGIKNNKKRINDILEKLDLGDKKHTNNRFLSGGMKRRLLIAKALVHDPKILILDEPTAGVDVELRFSLWQYIKELNQQGMTILLTTHYIEEAETLCDKIGIINKGELITLQKTKDLLKSMGNKKTLTLTFLKPQKKIPQSLTKFDSTIINEYEISINFESERINEALKAIQSIDDNIFDFDLKSQSLEEIFLNLTNTKK